MVLSLWGCGGGNYAEVNLNEPVTIPKDGVIDAEIIRRLQSENTIGTFQGSCGAFSYEWILFGSDITDPMEVNLNVNISDLGEEGIELTFAQQQRFGFPVLLSIQLPRGWQTQSATAYQADEAVYTVSLTGTKANILNLSVQDVLGTVVVRPDAVQEENMPISMQVPENTSEETQPEESSAGGYLSAVSTDAGPVYSEGQGTGLDQYNTSPVPAGKPMPVEPENQNVDTTSTYTCTFSIDCATILNNLDLLDPNKLEMVPSGGTILATTTVTFYAGESVFDVLQRICRERGIHMEAEWTPIYNSAYVEGIHNLYEFDCGFQSGWMYSVNGWYPNYGASRYALKQGDVVQWRYTCDYGYDVGGEYAVLG